MNKNVVVIPFAYIDGAKTGSNIKKKDNPLDVYCRYLVTSAISIKKNNEDCNVAVATNIVLSNKYSKLLEEQGVMIFDIPFDSFLFDYNYHYCLAFYKLCVLKHMNDYNYDNVMMVDADVYCHGSFSSAWNNCANGAIVYDRLGSTIVVPDCFRNIPLKQEMAPGRVLRAGGEFVVLTKKLLLDFVRDSENIFYLMKKHSFCNTSGDEFITSISLAINARCNYIGGRYIQRLETRFYRDVCKISQLNITPLLHLPGEKNRGLKKLYHYYVKHKAFPSNKKVYKYCHVYHRQLIPFLLSLVRGTFNKKLY